MDGLGCERIYLYDGSWEGALTAFYHACKAKEPCPRICCEDEGSLFGEYIRIHADERIAEEIAAAVVQKISRNALYRAGLLYLSECADFATVMYRYLLLGFSMGQNVDNFQSHEAVRSAHAISRKVCHEAHRFMGITRFESTSQGILYAAIEPSHNIVPMIASHFQNRLGSDSWVIHDVLRGIAALSSQGRYQLVPFTVEYKPQTSEDERFFKALWRRYYRTVAISQKQNQKLRNRYIPPRYFSHLTELNDSDW